MTPRLLSILILSFVLGMGAALAPARSGCYEGCQNSCKNMSGQITSWECVSTCNRYQCEKQSIRPSASYGAIAFGVTKMAEAISYRWGNEAAAARDALATCSKYGDDCKIVASYVNSCAALAAARGGHYATATGRTAREASASALNACHAKWGECQVDLSECSFP